jgi:hypothetical protein
MTIANRLEELEICPCGDYDLTDEEVRAVYHFEHRLLASLYRLYMRAPPEKADKVIGDVLRQIVSKLPRDD